LTKIALITDTHFGVRNDQISFLDKQKEFFDNVFFPTLEEQKIDRVIHLGDLVDRRKFINFNTLNRMKTDFLDRLGNQVVTIVAGNHDVAYRMTNSLNALDELLKSYKNFNLITKKPKHVDDFLYVPWITSDNREESFKIIKDSRAQYCFGHLELSGFKMNSGIIAEHGDDPIEFAHLGMVFSGHYHSKSSRGNIHYLGAPFAFNWGDYGTDRGFHILDTKTNRLTFIDNPYTLFYQLDYDEEKQSFIPELIENCYVKIVVRNKSSQSKFEEFLEKVQSKKPHDIKIVEQQSLEIDTEVFSGIETTPEIIKKYIEQIDVNVNKKELEKVMINLYQQASLLE